VWGKCEAIDDKRVEGALFLAPFLTFAYFYQGADQSTAARFDLMRALVERRTLWIDGYCGYNTADIISLGGHYYSVKAPGASLTGLLQWVLFSTTLAPLQAKHESLYWALTTHLTIVFSTGLIVAIACVAMYRLAIFLRAACGRAAVLALVLALSTIFFPYATEMTGEPIAGACAFIAFYLLVTHKAEASAGRAMVAGVATGWAVLCDFPAILIAGSLAIYAIARLRSTRQLLAFGAGGLAVAVLLLAYNDAAFGNPFFLSYQAYKLPDNLQFPEQAAGFVGLTHPRLDILWNILVDPQRGLFFCNPVLILAIPAFGFFAWQRRFRAEFLVVSFAIVSMILFNGSFGESIISWGGGTATGPRQIVAAVPFMVLALVFIPPRWGWVLGMLAAVSAFAMLMATAIEPHFPYEYGNPLRDFILPAYLRGDFAYNRDAYFSGPAIVDESTAFNLGKLAGLPGVLQLWPLAVLWLATALFLLHRCKLLPRGSPNQRLIRTGTLAAIVVMFASPAAYTMARFDHLTARHGLLASYYRAARPNGFPPHIVRVDPQIAFHSVAELGALPVPSHVSWSGGLFVPRTGRYHFEIDADDAGWLKIDSAQVISDPGDQNLPHASGDIYLSSGSHHLEAGELNLWGDASMTLSWQGPGIPPQVVPSSALLPARRTERRWLDLEMRH
jgi:hypothetical protein